MQYQMIFKVNDRIYLKNPELSELGKRIVKNSIDLMYEIGYEQFTFKKLASHMGTTEASIYRYFENKHRLLLYILNWYWNYMEYLVDTRSHAITDKRKRLELIIDLITEDLPESSGQEDYNKALLHQIVIRESSKVYLVKDVLAINKEEVFKPYKDLCAKIAHRISDYKSGYPYPRSLSATLIETAHDQQFFSKNLPRLTDVSAKNKKTFTALFLKDMVFRILK